MGVAIDFLVNQSFHKKLLSRKGSIINSMLRFRKKTDGKFLINTIKTLYEGLRKKKLVAITFVGLPISLTRL